MLERHRPPRQTNQRGTRIERSQTVWIVLDAGRLLRARVDVSATRLTPLPRLSLAPVALYSGDRIAPLATAAASAAPARPRGFRHVPIVTEGQRP